MRHATVRFVLTLVMLFSLQAFAQFRSVTVQNANTNPVPTTIQNTPTVNVGGTVPVSGTVSVAGPVSTTISGTPNVSIAGTPNVAVTSLPAATAVSGRPGCTSMTSADVDVPKTFFNGSAAFTSGSYPVFACTADLDGNGSSELIIGFVSSGTTGVFKVVIINSNGTIRATVPVN